MNVSGWLRDLIKDLILNGEHFDEEKLPYYIQAVDEASKIVETIGKLNRLINYRDDINNVY